MSDEAFLAECEATANDFDVRRTSTKDLVARVLRLVGMVKERDENIHTSCDIAGIPRYAADGTEIEAEHRVFAMALALRGRIETAEVDKLRKDGIRRALDDSQKLAMIRALFAAQEAQEHGHVDYDRVIRECLKEET